MSQDNHSIIDCDGHIVEFIASGRILFGCEGSEHTFAYLSKRTGVCCFAYDSDYPHEVDLPAAQHAIEEVAGRDDLGRRPARDLS